MLPFQRLYTPQEFQMAARLTPADGSRPPVPARATDTAAVAGGRGRPTPSVLARLAAKLGRRSRTSPSPA
ncbi:MAG TPA: hypothetical protein VHL53_05670 [Acidimicrobiia bacterium]|nr:hypothetical protein [Acidimicrobiia bacterium]